LQKNIFQKLFNKIVSKGNLDDNVKYRVIQKILDGKVRQYGHIGISSAKLASAAIDSLNNLNYQGCYLVVREYVHRAYINDRREMGWRDCPWIEDERRLLERRGSEEYFWGL